MWRQYSCKYILVSSAKANKVKVSSYVGRCLMITSFGWHFRHTSLFSTVKLLSPNKPCYIGRCVRASVQTLNKVLTFSVTKAQAKQDFLPYLATLTQIFNSIKLAKTLKICNNEWRLNYQSKESNISFNNTLLKTILKVFMLLSPTGV